MTETRRQLVVTGLLVAFGTLATFLLATFLLATFLLAAVVVPAVCPVSAWWFA